LAWACLLDSLRWFSDGAEHIGLVRGHVGVTVNDVLPPLAGQVDRAPEWIDDRID
jgi:hypothetical protein